MDEPKVVTVVGAGDVVLYALDRGSHVEALPATVVRLHPDGAADLCVHGAGRYLEATHVSRSPAKVAQHVAGTWRTR